MASCSASSLSTGYVSAARVHTRFNGNFAADPLTQGNKLLEEAARASDFRIFVVLFFVTAGCAVLFLHWYD